MKMTFFFLDGTFSGDIFLSGRVVLTMFWWNHRSHHFIIHVFLEIYLFSSICFIKHTTPRTCRFLKSLCFCFHYHSDVAYIYSYGKAVQPLGKHIHPQRKGWRDSHSSKVLRSLLLGLESMLESHLDEGTGWLGTWGDGGVDMYVYLWYIHIYIYTYIHMIRQVCIFIYTYDLYIYTSDFLFTNIYIYMIYRQVDRYLS